MMFAEMGIFNTSGPALAIGIVVSLLAGLTLTPALLATLGDRAFWPGQATHRANGRLYELTSKWVSTRPLAMILVIVAIMAPFSIYGVQPASHAMTCWAICRTINPPSSGFDVMKQAHGRGQRDAAHRRRHRARSAADRRRDRAPDRRDCALDGIAVVRSLNSPLGQKARTRKPAARGYASWTWRSTLLSTTQDAAAIDPSSDGQALLADVKAYLDLLAERFPEVARRSEPDHAAGPAGRQLRSQC